MNFDPEYSARKCGRSRDDDALFVHPSVYPIKAAFHYSSNLAANLVFDQVCSQVFDKFVRVCDAFDFIRRKPGREQQQVRWFVRVLDKWNVEKPVLSKFAAGFRSTCFRPACDQVFDQVCSWLE